jgi:hypothetical protein
VRAGLAQLSDTIMEKDEFDNEDFEKIFNEIIKSEDLQEVSKDFENEINLGIKELILLQQSLGDAISYISEILSSMVRGKEVEESFNEECFDLLGSLYKISEDFNECMIEYYADINVILLEDEDGDEGNYNDYEDGTDT